MRFANRVDIRLGHRDQLTQCQRSGIESLGREGVRQPRGIQSRSEAVGSFENSGRGIVWSL